MNTTEKLEQLIDQGAYEQARSEALQALRFGDATKELVAMFITADSECRIETLRTLVSEHPENCELLLPFVQQLISIGRSRIAHSKCTQALEKLEHEKEVYLVRRARVLASISAGITDTLVHDILILADSQLPGTERMWKSLIGSLAGANNPSLICAFQKLAETERINTALRNFFAAKAEELLAAESLMK